MDTNVADPEIITTNLPRKPAKIRIFICALCKQHFDSYKKRHRHYRTCLKLSKPSVDKVFTCCHCEKEFSDFNDRVQHYMQDHQRKEIGVQEKTLKCCLCDESFINTELRSQHYNEHHLDNDAVSRREQGNGDV